MQMNSIWGWRARIWSRRCESASLMPVLTAIWLYSVAGAVARKSLHWRYVVMFVQRGEQVIPGQRPGHGKGAYGVHVGRHDWHPGPALAGVQEGEGPLQRHLGTAFQGRALGPDHDILEPQLEIGFDTHG